MSTVVTAVLWACAVTCVLLAVSGFARMARTDGGWREAAGWTAPLVFTTAALVSLTAAGALPAAAGAMLAIIPASVVAWRSARAWRAIAKVQDSATATRAVLGLLGARIGDALWNAREDLREAGGALRPATAPDVPGSPRPAGPAAFRRRVPSLRDDTLLPDVPSAAEVSADLEAARVTVPPAWGALADAVASFEAEDADDLDEHMAGEAAGLLTYAQAAIARAENLASGAGLDPAIIAGHFEFADEVADLATAVALVVKRTRDVYADLRDFAESGGVMPHNARRWFNAGGPEGGQAA